MPPYHCEHFWQPIMLDVTCCSASGRHRCCFNTMSSAHIGTYEDDVRVSIKLAGVTHQAICKSSMAAIANLLSVTVTVRDNNVAHIAMEPVQDHAFCRHIILAVRHPDTGKWGALGLSRRAELMDKPLTYSTLADLLADYVASYKRWWHTVLRIRIGLPVPHDVMYEGQVSTHTHIHICM